MLDGIGFILAALLLLCAVLVADAGNTGAALAFGIPGALCLALAVADRMRRRGRA